MKSYLDILRELAKDDYYQSIYSCCKELGFKIFSNDYDFTKIQLWFLSFLSTYAVINMDIALGDVSKKVLENTTYEDAYMYFKNHGTKESKKQGVVAPSETVPKTSWIFKSKEK